MEPILVTQVYPLSQAIPHHSNVFTGWTARVETVLEYFQIPYTKTYVNLSAVKSISPTGFVPILKAASLPPEIYINDSVAICEFLAESHPELFLWPKDRILRTLARSAVAEMHSGFSVMRNTYDTNFVAKYTGNVPITEEGRKEIERMLKIWGEGRLRTVKRLAELGEKDEGFLFGGFGIADAFFWPVLWVRDSCGCTGKISFCGIHGWLTYRAAISNL